MLALRASAWSVIFENDYFLGKKPTDRFPNDDDYTQGIRFSLAYPRAFWWGRWVNRPDCSSETVDGACRRTTIVGGQNFYTPSEITNPDIIEADRPYAAWLYVGLAAHIASERELRTLELDVGTTGRAALGDRFQTTWHRWFGFPTPRGWRHQVQPVPGLVGLIGIGTTKSWRSSAAAGAIGRVGYNIQRRWTEKIPETFRVRRSDAGWEIHAFGGVESRLVGWNALLQHDTYTPRSLPAIERVVRDIEVGLLVGRGRYSGGFRWVSRSAEIKGGRRSNYAGPFFTMAAKRDWLRRATAADVVGSPDAARPLQRGAQLFYDRCLRSTRSVDAVDPRLPRLPR